ncbi:hypothetical protein ABZY06_02230 [Streptomyces sp. NPDC006540]|jgi:hypothetical protein|uniref:hypothetical protein n=1 Tax=Streptomyces sp. NPDC006540 TaxID=3155353 RepID=UPI0033BFA1DB
MDETLGPDGTGGLDLAQLDRQMRDSELRNAGASKTSPAEEAPTLVTCPARGRTTASTARGVLVA